jgi:hypothetical protein
MNSSKSAPVFSSIRKNFINKITPINIEFNKKKNLTELPFGWGDGEPPTPDDEIELPSEKEDEYIISSPDKLK